MNKIRYFRPAIAPLCLLLALCLLLPACTPPSPEPEDHTPPPEDNSPAPDEGTAKDEPSTSGDENIPSDEEASEDDQPSAQEARMRALGLCVTEGGLPTTRTAIRTRFAEYKKMGITSVRIDTMWGSPSRGVWQMSDTTRHYLEAAREYGLLLKLILPTIMAPPAWLSADESSRLVDYNGRKSINTVSYWYDGIEEYTDMALRAQLKAIINGGWSDVIGAVLVDMGPAGEPLYPPAWTQVANGLDNANNGEEVMWCYGDNAQADFRADMQSKYGSIEAANAAWSTAYASFDAISVPKPEQTSGGALWGDVLTWYRDSKREFMDAQVRIFKKALADMGLTECPLILYVPGADMSERQWNACIGNGSASLQIRICCDNQYSVQLADRYGCYLQYTGITGRQELRMMRNYMYENGYGDIPVFGENAGDATSAGDIGLLVEIIEQFKLYGIDYTHARWLFESDGITRHARCDTLTSLIPRLSEYLDAVDISTAPIPAGNAAADPDGDVLRLDISFDAPASESLAYLFVPLCNLSFEVQDGDTLEYDVCISEGFQGVGAIDGTFIGGQTMRDHFGLTDTEGIRVHPNADLRDFCYPNWYHRSIKLGNSASDGQMLQSLMLAAHPEKVDGDFSSLDVTVFYDNIVIVRDGEILCEIFRDDGDISLSPASMSRNATCELSVDEY